MSEIHEITTTKSRKVFGCTGKVSGTNKRWNASFPEAPIEHQAQIEYSVLVVQFVLRHKILNTVQHTYDPFPDFAGTLNVVLHERAYQQTLKPKNTTAPQRTRSFPHHAPQSVIQQRYQPHFSLRQQRFTSLSRCPSSPSRRFLGV